MNAKPDISVVIPTRDRTEVLERTLAALARQRLDPGVMEVIVVDNGSAPEALRRVRELRLDGPFTLMVLSESRPGAPAARNTGVSAALGEHVLFLGDDTRPADPSLVGGHLRALAARPGRPIAVLGGCIWDPEVEVTPVMDWLERTGKMLDYQGMEPGEGPMVNLYSGNFSLRRGDLVEVGGFDERFSQYGWACYDLALRLEDRGFRLNYQPELLVLHDHRYGLRDSLRRMELVGRAAHLLNRLHASRTDLVSPRPRGIKAGMGRALAPLTSTLPVPDWLPRAVRDPLFRVFHYAALARGYAQPPLDDDPRLRGGLREPSVA